MLKVVSLFALVALIAAPAQADWMLDNVKSRVSFATTKAGVLGEVHSFKSLSGSVDSGGAVSISIDLASVDTLIPIRDERMRDLLFQTSIFPTAMVTANLDATALAGLSSGETVHMIVNAELSLRGQMLPIALDLVVAKLSSSRLMVSSLQPTIVAAAQVDLVAGVEALREIAGLPSISPSVPVSVVLAFDAAP
jgi:polyisoprenoid-binding protein YceI